MYVCMYVCMSVCLYVCMSVCLSVCLSVFTCRWLEKFRPSPQVVPKPINQWGKEKHKGTSRTLTITTEWNQHVAEATANNYLTGVTNTKVRGFRPDDG